MKIYQLYVEGMDCLGNYKEKRSRDSLDSLFNPRTTT
jgi:hypothetical protein